MTNAARPLTAAVLAIAPACALAACGAPAEKQADPAPGATVPAEDGIDYAAIVADQSRSAAHRAADPARKPLEMLEFTGVKPGMAVFDMLPGSGYFTYLFASVVGERGEVALYSPVELDDKPWNPLKRAHELAEETGLPNVSVAHFPLAGPVPGDMAERFDLVWTSRNYHDFHNIEGFDGKAYNAMVLDLLKPGGIYVVLDHSAPEGTGAESTGTTHRIDRDFVRKEVASAGFLYDGASAVLSNPEDGRDISVHDPAIKGRTDQFVLRFRKPG